MELFSKSKKNFFEKIFSTRLRFSKTDQHSLRFLNIAQFMGVLNDNIFKLVIAFLLIDIKGKEHASTILAMAGALFVIPFLLFSSTAGIVADRFSKQRLLVGMKLVEIVVMGLAIIAFGFKSIWGSYTLLFLLATHSALFGPAKYAIISELVPPDRVSRANGLITSFTYLGMILGTFLASFLTEITSKGFVIVACICLLIAIIGFFSTLGIGQTPAQNNQKRINLFFVREIYHTLRFCRHRKHLLMAMTGSAYFLFIGGYTQLNIIPFAIDSLGLSSVHGGYLFLCTALGIALGSYIGGKASKRHVELGLSCLAGFFIAILLLILYFVSSNLSIVIIILLLLGLCGGLFIVPLDSFVQLFSPDEKRGQIIAANNFLSFAGVLIASLALFFYSDFLGLSAATGFGVTGLITLVLALFMTAKLSDLAIPFFTRLSIKPLTRLVVEGSNLFEDRENIILVLQNATWKKICLLTTEVADLHFVLPLETCGRLLWLKRRFYSLHYRSSEPTYEPLMKEAEKLLQSHHIPCIVLQDRALPDILMPAASLVSLFKRSVPKLIYVQVERLGLETYMRFAKTPFPTPKQSTST